MSVNIQTKAGLARVAENCGCESEGGTASEQSITAQPVEIVDELRIGDFEQLTGVAAFSPDDITAQPVDVVDELRIGDFDQLTGVAAFSPDDITVQPVEDVTELYNEEV